MRRHLLSKRCLQHIQPCWGQSKARCDQAERESTTRSAEGMHAERTSNVWGLPVVLHALQRGIWAELPVRARHRHRGAVIAVHDLVGTTWWAVSGAHIEVSRQRRR